MDLWMNMGHCGAIVGYNIIEYVTYGDIFKNWWRKCESDSVKDFIITIRNAQYIL